MTSEDFNLEEEQKALVLVRFKTLNPNSKIMLGGDKEVSVKELIDHINKGDEFGKRIVQAHIKMLQVLARGE